LLFLSNEGFYHMLSNTLPYVASHLPFSNKFSARATFLYSGSSAWLNLHISIWLACIVSLCSSGSSSEDEKSGTI
jgi:hypothetical protein